MHLDDMLRRWRWRHVLLPVLIRSGIRILFVWRRRGRRVGVVRRGRAAALLPEAADADGADDE
jgi:hypothetical protein